MPRQSLLIRELIFEQSHHSSLNSILHQRDKTVVVRRSMSPLVCFTLSNCLQGADRYILGAARATARFVSRPITSSLVSSSRRHVSQRGNMACWERQGRGGRECNAERIKRMSVSLFKVWIITFDNELITLSSWVQAPQLQ